MCELALTKAQSEKRKVKSESAKRKRVLTPLGAGDGSTRKLNDAVIPYTVRKA